MKPGMSLRGYARHRRCRLNAVQEALAAGRIPKSCLSRDGRIVDVEGADAAWAASTFSDRRPLTGPAGGGLLPELAESRARRESAEADMAEIELAQLRRELIPASDIESGWAAEIASVKTKLLGIPSRVRQMDPSLTVAQVVLLETTIRESLDDLAAGRVL